MSELHSEIAKHFAEHQHIAHGIDHAERVGTLARYIAAQESYDTDEAEIAGLLHDMGRTVQVDEKGHGPAGVPLASQLLNTYTDYPDKTKERILNAVRDHSNLHTEGTLTHIIQDADMLDGLGAIGIMRAYTSKATLPCYDPLDVAPTEGSRDSTIHGQIAFQMEWLDMMHTPTGRTIAEKRHARMRQFLDDFKLEAQGQDF